MTIDDSVYGSFVELRFPANIGITGAIIKSKEHIFKNDDDPLPNGYTSDIDNALKFQGIKNFIFCPIIGKNGSCIGVLHMFNKQNDKIDKFDIVYDVI